MKTFLILTSCVIIGAASVQEEFVRGIPEKTRIRGGRSAQPSITDFCTAGKAGSAYCDDTDVCVAKKLMVCKPTVGQAWTFPTDESNPYCYVKTGETDADLYAVLPNPPPNPACSAPVAPGFECLSEGIFPDPQDCHKYYDCYENSANTMVTNAINCPPSYVFDPSDPTKAGKFCRLGETYCTEITCTGSKNENFLLKYPFFYTYMGQYGVTCRKDTPGSPNVVNPPLVVFCPAGLLLDQTKTIVECKMQCSYADQVAAYVQDDTRYYRCYLTPTGSLEASLDYCKGGQTFDPDTKKCTK